MHAFYSSLCYLSNEASVLLDAPHDEAEVASTFGVHVVELMRSVLVAVIQGMNLDDGISDGSLEGISDVSLDELDVAGEGSADKLGERHLRDVHTTAILKGLTKSNSIIASDGTDQETEVLLVDGVDDVTSEHLGRVQEVVDGAGSNGSTSEKGKIEEVHVCLVVY